MANSAIKANVYGPVLSCLLYDNVRCSGDQEGFLLGHISERMLDSMDDSQMNNQQEETIIDIQSIITCDSPYSFYNNCGDVDKKKLTAMLKNEQKEIIGWYRFRRNSSLEPLYLERIIHNNLALAFSRHCRYFLLALFTTISNSNLSTHSFDHAILVGRSDYESIPLLITNLGAGSQADYKDYNTLRPNSKTLENTQLPNTTTIVQGIQNSLESDLKALSLQVWESENSLQQARREIELLKTQLHIRSKNIDSPEGSGFFPTAKNSSVQRENVEMQEVNSSTVKFDGDSGIQNLSNTSEWMIESKDKATNCPSPYF